MKEKIVKVISKVKETKWYLVVLTIFFIFAIMINKPFKNDYNYEFRYNHIIQGGRTPQIESGVEVSQNFIAKGNNLDQIGMMIAMPSISTQSTVNVKLIEVESQIQILDQDVFLGSLKDGDYFVVNIENQFNSRGKEYKIILKGLDGDSTNSIQILKSTVSDENLLGCYVGDKKDDCNWVFLSRYYLNYNKYEAIAWISLYLMSFFFVIFMLDNNANEKSFLKMSICLGVFSILFTGFFHPFDEPSHYFRALLVSQGDFYDTITDDGQIGGYVPKNYDKYVGLYTNLHLKTIILDPTVLTETYDSEFKFVKNTDFSSNVPTAHIVPAIGLFIGRIAKLGEFECLLLARVSVFIFYILLCYLAIKNMPYYKKTMIVVAMTPISLWLAGTIHLDPIITSVSLHFISICLKYHWENETKDLVSKRDLALIVLCAVFLITCKYFTLVPVLLLFFLIPPKRFGNRKNYWIFLIFAIVLGLILVLWQFYMINRYSVIENRNGHTDIKEQLNNIINHFSAAIVLFISKILEMGAFWTHGFSYDGAISIIGRSTGIVLLISSIIDPEKPFYKDRKSKVVFNSFMMFEYCFILLLGLLALYLVYTPVGMNDIQGYQVRYLIPFIMFILISIGNTVKIENKITNYSKLLMFTMLIMNLDIIIGELIKTF